MQAGWEGDTTTGGSFEVTVAKPDGTLARAVVAADGTVQVTAMADDYAADKSDNADNETDDDQDDDKG